MKDRYQSWNEFDAGRRRLGLDPLKRAACTRSIPIHHGQSDSAIASRLGVGRDQFCGRRRAWNWMMSHWDAGSGSRSPRFTNSASSTGMLGFCVVKHVGDRYGIVAGWYGRKVVLEIQRVAERWITIAPRSLTRPASDRSIGRFQSRRIDRCRQRMEESARPVGQHSLVICEGSLKFADVFFHYFVVRCCGDQFRQACERSVAGTSQVVASKAGRHRT